MGGRAVSVALQLGVLALLLASCAAPQVESRPPGDAPYLLVLGTGQDGGRPQLGCELECCAPARADAARRRLPTCLLLADPRDGRRWLFEATPALPEQVERARSHPPTRQLSGPRPPLFEGVFLTHAHVGHFAGLLQFGREIYGARELPVHASPRMLEFLTTNGPWSLSFEEGHLLQAPLAPGERLQLAPDLAVRALAVPHREEFSDTLAFVIEGPRRSVLFLPDIDKWERWELPLEDVLAQVDLALIDGSFFAEGEIPGRSMADIPHPFVPETLERLAPLPPDERAKVRFLHLNHTNRMSDPEGPEAAAVRAAGSAVADELEWHAL